MKCTWSVRRSVIIATLAVPLLMPVSANATDNVPPGLYHWHVRPVTYRINSNVPSDWKTAIREGAAAWASTPMTFARGSDITNTNYGDSGTHIVWRGAIPTAWTDGCPVTDTLACTRSVYYQGQAPFHIADDDTVFNSAMSMGTSGFNCTFFGVATTDVETVATHEFGHWGLLDHTTDATAAMFTAYTTCRRDPTSHDVDSMKKLYKDASH